MGTRRIRSDVSLMLASMFSGMGHFIISNQGNPYVRAPGKVPSAQGWEEGLGEGEGSMKQFYTNSQLKWVDTPKLIV